jgi:pyruvate dehydrogenase E2 component (dihydrolipoamide acetyltransferase)
MLLETCRYRFVDGKVITKMFGMKGNDWDIDEGWHHSPKDAKADHEQALKQGAYTIDISKDDETVKASRFARKLADELEIDINEVIGTGKNGIITKDDITNHYNEG